MENTLPMLREPVNLMMARNDSRHQMTDRRFPQHPVEIIQKQHVNQQREMRKLMMGQLCGSHVPLSITMEERILSQFRRGPGLQSSFLGLDILTKRDGEIEFTDYLNDPEFREDLVNVHTEMEIRMGDEPLARFF